MRKLRTRRARPMWIETLENRSLLSGATGAALVAAQSVAASNTNGASVQAVRFANQGGVSAFSVQQSEGGYTFTDTYNLAITRAPGGGQVGSFDAADAFNTMLDRFAAIDSNVAGTPAASSNADLAGNYAITSEQIKVFGGETVYSLNLTGGGYRFAESLTVKAAPSASGVGAFSTNANNTFGNFVKAFSAAATTLTGNSAFGSDFTGTGSSSSTGTSTNTGTGTGSTSGTGTSSGAGTGTSTGAGSTSGTGTSTGTGSTSSTGSNSGTATGTSGSGTSTGSTTGSTSGTTGTGTTGSAANSGTGTGSGTSTTIGAGTGTSGTSTGTTSTTTSGGTAGTGAGVGTNGGTASGDGTGSTGSGTTIDSGGGTGGTNGSGLGGSTGTGSGVTTGTSAGTGSNDNTGTSGQGLSTGQ